jgi:hypothetical protein
MFINSDFLFTNSMQETGRSVLKFQNALKNAMQMTHMLEGMLSVSVCQQFFEMVK